jgi:pimeloyl-ACP methyl ester carboxylesterase
MRITASDGVPLNVLCSDMRHEDTVVLVNAPGISCEVSERLMRELDAHGMSFVTWDLRGSPGAGDDFRAYRTSHHVQDLEVILEALAPRRMVLASWCSGTPTALKALVEGRVDPVGFAAFCVPNFAATKRLNLPGDTIERVCSLIVKDEAKAAFFFDAMVARSGLDKVTADLVDPRMQALVLAPFKSGVAALLRYAYAIANRPEPAEIQAWCAALRVPSVFVGGKKDAMVSHLDTIGLSRFVPASRCDVLDHWNHYGLFWDTRTVVEQFACMFGRVVKGGKHEEELHRPGMHRA